MKIKHLLKLIPFLSFLFISNISLCQLINGSFEEWDSIQNFEKPTNWDTNQDSMFTRIEKDTVSIEGDYSLKFISTFLNPWMTDCKSELTTGINLENELGENKSLFFYVKSISDNNAGTTYLKVHVRLFENGTYTTTQWINYEEIDTFTQIEIPLTNPQSDSIAILIYGSSNIAVNDYCEHYSFTWLDGMEIKESITSEVKSISKNNDIRIFPNPSKGIIHLEGEVNEITSYKVFNSIGEELTRGTINNSKIHLNYTGLLILIFETKSKETIVKKVLVN